MQKNLEFTDRDFFKKPFSLTEIENLLQGKPAAEMFNFRSPSFKKLELDREKMTDREMIDLMMSEPRLIRRPIIQIGKKVYFNASTDVLADLIKPK